MLRGVLPVAVKMLNEEAAGGKAGRDAFMREVVTLKNLVSPMIVQFLCALNPKHQHQLLCATIAIDCLVFRQCPRLAASGDPVCGGQR